MKNCMHISPQGASIFHCGLRTSYHLRLGYILTLFILFSACGKSRNSTTSTLFTLMPGDQTGLHFQNSVPDQADNGLNIIQYLYYYNGGGVATGYLNADTLPDIYFTSNLGDDAVYINRGNFKFEKVVVPYPLDTNTKWTTGVTFADVNGDGREDIYVCQVGNYKQIKGRNLLYINQGEDQQGIPKYKEAAETYGLGLSAFCTQSAFFDYDHDGDLDCFIICHSVHSAGVYRDTAQTRKYDPLAADRLYRNDNGRFTDMSVQMGIYGGMAGYGLGLSVSDLNGDGWADIYVGNDFHESDYVYISQAGKGFIESTSQSLGHSSNFTMGTDAADMNNDGRMDLMTLDMLPPDEYTRKASQPVDQLDIFQYKHSLGYDYQYPRNAMQSNLGNTKDGIPLFGEIGQLAGVDATDWSWSVLLADYDLDGNKDIFITNGIRRRGNNLDFLKYTSTGNIQKSASDAEIAQHMPEGHAPNQAFRNSGNYRFEQVSQAWGLDFDGYSNGSAYADFDGDGDLDLVINNLNSPAQLYKNESKQKNRLKLRLNGSTKNLKGLGAKVSISSGATKQAFEVMATRGFESAVEPIVVCGLPDNQSQVEVEVRWPDGKLTRRTVSVGGLASITMDWADTVAMPQASGMDDREGVAMRDLPKAIKKELTQTKQIKDKLVPWNSMANYQKIVVSHKYPNRVFVCGTEPQFIDLEQNTSKLIANMSDVTAAAFCDIDADGKEEILVGVRGLMRGSGMEILREKNGQWLADTSFFLMSDEIAVIAPADIDGDGDQDLYVGCGVKTGAYGQVPQSHLLINAGHGRFGEPDTRSLNGMAYPGMVRDAFWADLNGDKTLDLAVCGEWMPLSFYLSDRRKI